MSGMTDAQVTHSSRVRGAHRNLRANSGHLYCRLSWLQRVLPRQECELASSARTKEGKPCLHKAEEAVQS